MVGWAAEGFFATGLMARLEEGWCAGIMWILIRTGSKVGLWAVVMVAVRCVGRCEGENWRI